MSDIPPLVSHSHLFDDASLPKEEAQRPQGWLKAEPQDQRRREEELRGGIHRYWLVGGRAQLWKAAALAFQSRFLAITQPSPRGTDGKTEAWKEETRGAWGVLKGGVLGEEKVTLGRRCLACTMWTLARWPPGALLALTLGLW